MPQSWQTSLVYSQFQAAMQMSVGSVRSECSTTSMGHRGSLDLPRVRMCPSGERADSVRHVPGTCVVDRMQQNRPEMEGTNAGKRPVLD
jgi:hypothetical protein